MYDNGAMESYMTEDSLESAALMKGNHKRKVGGILCNSVVVVSGMGSVPGCSTLSSETLLCSRPRIF